MTSNRSEETDPTGPEDPEDDARQLTSRQQEIAEELRHLHPDLASLYIRGVGLLPELDEAGVPLLVAHIGRELALGVRNILLNDEEFELPEAEARSVPDDESHRESIARTLQLPPNDPRVAKWHQVYKDLTRWAHFRISSPDPLEVRKAFEDLEIILHGQVGPYFATRAELDDFLSLDDPSADDVERLQPYLLRPSQRRYFFQELENPSWVPLLAETGTFSDPPEWIGNEDDGWQPRPWPEGQYLARVAEDVPDQIVEVVQTIPSDLKNPVVWDALCRAATRIPPVRASETVPKFRDALHLPTAPILAEKLAGLARHLASNAQEAAFPLANDLLHVPSSEEIQADEEESSLPSDGRWILPRIDWPGGEMLFDRAVPALHAADGLRTLELLLSKLNQGAVVLRALDRETMFWRPDYFDIEGEADRPDSPERLFLAAVRVLRATAPRDEEIAQQSLELVDGMSDEIAHRLRYVLLAEAGHMLPEEVDEELVSEAAIRPGIRARELALFLREQFENASIHARRLFRYALEQGPTLKEVKGRLAFSEVDEPSEEDLRNAVRSWKLRRIRWFRGQVPDELVDIAESVGITPGERPSVEERELAEVGVYSSGASWVGPQSPVEDEEIEEMDPDEIVRKLAEHDPESRSREGHDFRGLSDALGRLAASDPSKVVDAGNIAVEADFEAPVLRAFVEALRQAVEQGTSVNWSGVLSFASASIGKIVGERSRAAAQLGAAVAELLNTGFSEDAIPMSECDSAWEVLTAVARAEALWEPVARQGPDGVQGVLTMALNHPSGKMTRAVRSGMLWLFRAIAPDDARLNDEAPEARKAIAEKALPVLEDALNHDGQAATAVEAILGRNLPTIHYLAPDWLAERSGTLLRPGCERPLDHPAWPSFVWQWNYVGPMFEAYCDLYLQTVQSVERLQDAEADASGRSVVESLASHLLVSVLQGAASVGDEDELIETAFENLPASARRHAYGGVFRSWTKAEEAPAREFVDRLITFWRWRLDQLSDGQKADVGEEARGLVWLIRTPYLPDADVAELGARTVPLVEGDVRVNTLWERLDELAPVDPEATTSIVLQAVEIELASDHPLVSTEDGIPVVRKLLEEADEERRRNLRRMVHRLGEAGFEQFGELLDEGE